MKTKTALLLFALFAATLAADQKTVTIKNIGILGPITGSQDTGGRVDIELTGRAAPVIDLRSSNPAVAAVPMTVTPTQGTAIFVVKTFPVTKPTDVTITAQVGASSKSATLSVLPPKLSVLGCDIPPNVIPQKPLKCTAWLDGLAPEPTTVSLSSSSPMATVPATVTIARGSSKEAFQVKAEPIAQSVSAQISATYAGVTKSAPVTVLPVALESFTIYPDRAWGGNNIDYIVKLTAPPPPSGLKIKFSAQFPPWEGRYWLPDPITMKSEQEKITRQTYGVNSEATITVTASSEFTAGDVRQSSVKMIPAPLFSVAIDPDHFANVPLGGQKANVILTFNGLPTAPHSSGVWIDLQYGGDTPITGPARIDAGTFYQPLGGFYVTVSPCSVQSTCTVFVKARFRGVEKQATATVSH